MMRPTTAQAHTTKQILEGNIDGWLKFLNNYWSEVFVITNVVAWPTMAHSFSGLIVLLH